MLLLEIGSRCTAAAGADEFSEAIAPILRTHCVRCHNASVKKGGLSLATGEALRSGGDAGPAIEVGKPDESLLIEKITGDRPEMPKGGKPLTPEEVAALRRWVERGAQWTVGLALKPPTADAAPWWAVQPLRHTDPPTVKNPQWLRTPIDAFVLKTLEAKQLSPRPEADRRTLIRRLTFDLHGLPPTPKEVDAFVRDERDDAYERLVDRLLASPQYGERSARHWLDLVHYGDTHGYDKDKKRNHAWRYRDYVILAFNDDVPYEQFILEQLAGDVLFPDRPDAAAATGFISAGPWDFVGHVELAEGTVEKEKTRLIDRDDMVMNTMSTFQSLTVHCARCHDHKFDPIPQRDYYRLQAVFAGVDRGDRPFTDHANSERLLALRRDRDAAAVRVARIDRRVEAVSSPALEKLDDSAKSLRAQLAEMKPAAGGSSPTNGYHSHIRPSPDEIVWVEVDLGAVYPIDEIRVIPARPTDFPDTPGFGFPPRFRVESSKDALFSKPERIVESVRGDQERQADEPLVLRPGGRQARIVRVTATRLWKRSGDFVFALGELEVVSGGENVARGAVVSALDSIEGGRWSKAALVDGFSSRGRRPKARDPIEIQRIELIFLARQAEEARDRLRESLTDPLVRAEQAAARTELGELDRRLQAEPITDMVYAVVPREPRTIHVLSRGEVEQPREEVGPGALACVPGASFDDDASQPEGRRRAALARWIASPSNVLTWRSIVNRVWLSHFGRGIVETPSDFGRNGASPSHPELLDWLAVEFFARGQSLKALHRLIVESATYRQSSAHDDASARIDAENRYYWRMNRRRLDAESIRDAALSVSGQLDLRMGGPAFEPFRFKDDHSPIYDHDAVGRATAPETRRRSIYRFTVRSVPDPFLDSLDCADPNANVPVRNTTLTAPQALALLNDPFIQGRSEAFARRLEASGARGEAEIDDAFTLCYGRGARPDERRVLSQYIAKHGLPNACRLLLNANEFVFID
jgi:Protein of unknown function (DUF1553)/Protein of unknown function (DUF1549)/Planctomycete cytochrome C